MKTILIPTNFSDISRHATDYALKLYGNEKLKIILLNSFEQPKTGRSLPLSLVEIMRKNSERGLKEDELRIKEIHPDLNYDITICATQGDLSDSIKTTLKDYEIDIIVMGSSGSQELVDIFIESTTARVIKNVDHPMLIVPPIAAINGLKSIILTTDCKPISDVKILEELNYLCEKNNCDIKVLHISKTPCSNLKDNEQRISTLLENIPHSFNYRVHKDIPSGIYKFIYETNADIVTLIKRKGSGRLVDRLFHQSVSRRIVKHVRQTLLLFSDQNY